MAPSKTKKRRSLIASCGGVFVSVLLATTFIDFDKFDVSSINQWRDLLICILPAIGGWSSEIKAKSLNDAAEVH